jgi:hypothetical protein
MSRIPTRRPCLSRSACSPLLLAICIVVGAASGGCSASDRAEPNISAQAPRNSAPPAPPAPGFRCLGPRDEPGVVRLTADEFNPPELNCLEYWRRVLRDYPNLPGAVDAILADREEKTGRADDGKGVSITLTGTNGPTTVSGESVHVVITDLDTPTLERLQATLRGLDGRRQELDAELAKMEAYAQAMATPADRIAARIRKIGENEARPAVLRSPPRLVLPRDESGFSLLGSIRPLRRYRPPPPPVGVIVLGSSGHVAISGIGGTGSQHIDIKILDDTAHGTGRIDIYAFTEGGNTWAHKFQRYLTKSGRTARPPPTAQVLAIGSLASLSVGDARDSAQQFIKLDAWIADQPKRSDELISDATKEVMHMESRTRQADDTIARGQDAQLRERLARAMLEEERGGRREEERFKERMEVRPRAP